MVRNITYIAWLALVLAVLAWLGVGLFASTILAEQGNRAADVQQLQDSSSQASQALDLHALVSDTASARTALTGLVTVDPASLAQAIDTAGTSAGIPIEISDASSGSAPAVSGGTATQAFAFTAASQGSFAAVMRAAQILETLPVPSSIQEIQIIRSPDAAGTTGLWQMSAQVQALTASTVSS